MNPARVLPAAGLAGAVLTVVILAMTVLMRLTTGFEDGRAVSTLSPEALFWVRLAHRVAAGAVGIAAAAALLAGRNRAALVVVALTLLLAVVGRHSAGYVSDLATVVNVAGGVALVAAFWRLRRPPGAQADPVATAALVLLVALTAAGAATDAAAMRGERAFGPLHMWVGAIFVGCALVAAWRQRARLGLAAALAALALAQPLLGAWILASGRPVAAGWLHAMAACFLAVLLTYGKRPVGKGA